MARCFGFLVTQQVLLLEQATISCIVFCEEQTRAYGLFDAYPSPHCCKARRKLATSS